MTLEVPTDKKLWTDVLSFGFLVFVLSLLFVYVRDDMLDGSVVSIAFAWASVIMVGLSFALSGICYFWNFADKLILYRKDLGLTGFGFALIHGAYSVYEYPGVVSFANTAFLFGFASLVIYAIMTVVSNKYIIARLGSDRWRKTLRFGYVGIIFSVIHVLLMTSLMNTIPLVLFVVFVLGLRVALEISLRTKKKVVDGVIPADPTLNYTPLPKNWN